MATVKTPKFYWPRNDEHTAIVGRNGSGKTQAGAFILSAKDLRNEAWTILDYKDEEIFRELKNTREIGFNDVPTKPGLYHLRARYGEDDAETEAWMSKVYDTQNHGIYIDEGYMLPQLHKGAFAGILTQGRSRRIPTITLTQRPVKVNPLVFSEAKHIVVFDLNRKRDWQTVEEATGDGFTEWLPDEFAADGLPPWHARWFAVGTKGRYVLRPVPSAEKIIAAIDAQLPPKRRWF